MPRQVRRWVPTLVLLATFAVDDAAAQSRFGGGGGLGGFPGGRFQGGGGFGGGRPFGGFGGGLVPPRFLPPQVAAEPSPDRVARDPHRRHHRPVVAAHVPRPIPRHSVRLARLPAPHAPVRLPSPRRPRTPRLAIGSFVVPPATEQRYVPGEILVVTKGASPADLRRLETDLLLSPVATTRIELLDGDVRRYRLASGAALGTTVAALQTRPFVTAAEPNYLFELQGDTGAATTNPPSAPVTPSASETAKPANTAPSVQYAVTALHLIEAHAIAEGDNVRVAIIDSGLDETNPELRGMVVARFDAVGGTFTPHAHGTAMGGTIVAHQTLVGIAPKARLIAIRAFTGASGSANGTGFDILRGVDFAAANGARIVNMSFAGPEDELLKQALAAARQRGVVAIAAAGNAGPWAKPLYPAAEPGVIAVTATDAAGKAFALANRGSYIAFAAPGVAILAPGLGDAVQITSGTSIATAEASGVAALLIERNPKESPDDIVQVLRTTAHKLTIEPEAGGAGVIDAAAALAAEK